MNENIDARIIKSKKSLKNSLIKLMNEKPFDKINVSEICVLADIHRMTFYNHYEDKYALFKDAIKDMCGKFERQFCREVYTNKNKNSIDKSVDFFELTIKELIDNEHILKSVSISKDYAKLFEIVKITYEETFYNICMKIFKDYSDELSFKVKFYCGGICNMIYYYLLNRNKINYKDYKAQLTNLITSLTKN